MVWTFCCWISLAVPLSQQWVLGLWPSIPYWICSATPCQFHLEPLRFAWTKYWGLWVNRGDTQLFWIMAPNRMGNYLGFFPSDTLLNVFSFIFGKEHQLFPCTNCFRSGCMREDQNYQPMGRAVDTTNITFLLDSSFHLEITKHFAISQDYLTCG